MTYEIGWYRYPHGRKTEKKEYQCRFVYNSIEKAITMLTKRHSNIKPINWAGGYINEYEIDKSNARITEITHIYEIGEDHVTHDRRKKS